MEENNEVNVTMQEAPAEQTAAKSNFNDNLHGENLTERAKVLSPWMTVAKRFFRSKLSIIGLVVIIFFVSVLFCGTSVFALARESGYGYGL